MVRKIHIDAIRQRAQELAKKFGADPEKVALELTQAHVRHRIPLDYPPATLTVMAHSHGTSQLVSHGPTVVRFNKCNDFEDTIRV